MYTRQDLTEEILRIPEGTGVTEEVAKSYNINEILTYFAQTDQQLYVELVRSSPGERDVAPSDLYRDENAYGLKMFFSHEMQNMIEGDPYFIIAYSNANYFRPEINHISLVQFWAILATAIENHEKCRGIVINPQSEARFYLSFFTISKLWNAYCDERKNFTTGDRIEIADGPFKHRKGVVKKLDKKKELAIVALDDASDGKNVQFNFSQISKDYSYQRRHDLKGAPLQYSGKALTDVILKGSIDSAEWHRETDRVLKDLYNYPGFCLFAAASVIEDKIGICLLRDDDWRLDILKGNYMVVYSEKKFILPRLSQDIIAWNAEHMFDTFLDLYHRQQCKGIVFNPGTEASFSLSFISLFSLFDKLGISRTNPHIE